ASSALVICCLMIILYNDSPPTQIYPLSLHDALPISDLGKVFPTAGISLRKVTPELQTAGTTDRNRQEPTPEAFLLPSVLRLLSVTFCFLFFFLAESSSLFLNSYDISPLRL